MKKFNLLITASILVLSPPANAELTFGLDLIQDFGDRNFSLNNSNYNTSDVVADSTGYRLKLSLGAIDENRAELYFSQYDVDDSSQFNDSMEWDLGMNYIFTFLQKPFIPFVKVGFGLGQADTDLNFIKDSGDTTDNILNSHLNLGGGLSYSFTDNLAVTAGLEYIYRSWQDVEYNNDLTLSRTDSVFRFGVGVDVTF
jgi:opacity protein-like surface antigen